MRKILLTTMLALILIAPMATAEPTPSVKNCTAALLCTYTNTTTNPASTCTWVYIWNPLFPIGPQWVTISKTESPAGACGSTPPAP